MATVNVISDLGGSFSYELRATGRSRIGLGRGRGSASGSTGTGIAWVLVEGGEGSLAVGRETADVGGRDDVFDEPGWSALIGPKTPLAVRGALRYTMIWRSWTEEAPTRIIAPDEVVEQRHGEGTEAWSIRAYVSSGPMTCGETVAGPGAWSSWPPHRHDHEEVLLYRFDSSARLRSPGVGYEGGRPARRGRSRRPSEPDPRRTSPRRRLTGGSDGHGVGSRGRREHARAGPRPSVHRRRQWFRAQTDVTDDRAVRGPSSGTRTTLSLLVATAALGWSLASATSAPARSEVVIGAAGDIACASGPNGPAAPDNCQYDDTSDLIVRSGSDSGARARRQPVRHRSALRV